VLATPRANGKIPAEHDITRHVVRESAVPDLERIIPAIQ